ncbi:MAG: dihydroneopterin aldolase [Planctomycetota bacterium]|jgi:dihydroneopterin aldolase
MRDTIRLEGLEVRGIIGVEEWERRDKQTIVIDLEMACDASAAARDDDIEAALNYRSVAKAIIAHVEDNAYRLVETLAVRLAEMVQRDFGVTWLRLCVSKPGAVRFSENVGIEVERGHRESGSS